jgi:hypothetical protein
MSTQLGFLFFKLVDAGSRDLHLLKLLTFLNLHSPDLMNGSPELLRRAYWSHRGRLPVSCQVVLGRSIRRARQFVLALRLQILRQNLA